jgi:hypothetical protein
MDNELLYAKIAATATTGPMQRLGIERHRVLAGTYKDRTRIDHRLSHRLGRRPGAGGYAENNISV